MPHWLLKAMHTFVAKEVALWHLGQVVNVKKVAVIALAAKPVDPVLANNIL